MLPAKLALATTMLVAAPAWFAVTATRDPEPAISDPAGHVFVPKVQPGEAAKPGEAPIAAVVASGSPQAAQPGAAQSGTFTPGASHPAEPPRRVVKVLVDSPFALPAGTVAIPAYDKAKPGPVPTPGSTLGSISPDLPRRATTSKDRAEQAVADENVSASIKAKQRAAKARGLWKEAPPAFADETPDAGVTGALADEPAAPEPRRRAMSRHPHYAQAPARGPIAVFNSLFH